MKFTDLIALREGDLAAAIVQRAAYVTEQEKLLQSATDDKRDNLSDVEQARFDELSGLKRSSTTAAAAVETTLAELRAEQKADAQATVDAENRSPAAALPTRSPAKVGAEPETYRKGGQQSYFKDLFRATTSGDRASLERLQRNDAEVRALTTTDGTGGDFVPPLWMVQDYVGLARAGRVVADNVRQEPLPTGTDTISLPAVVTGTTTAQHVVNAAVSETDATTGTITAAVFTVAGGQTLPVQLLEQSPINLDTIILADLAADYGIKLDTAVINSTNTNGKGLLNVVGVNAVTFTSASPTAQLLYPKVADGIQQVHTGRFLPPTHHFMHPRRWAWLTAALDTVGRPLVVPAAAMSENVLAAISGVNSEGFVGTFQGLPVYVDPNIPITLGAGTQDAIITCRALDTILFEGSPKAEAFRETKANTMQVFVRFYNYYALHSARYPKSVSVIQGTGLIAPTF
jgi:HK97 family phage major capsid protein